MSEDLFDIFDAHIHFSQAYLDQGWECLDRCGVRGGANLWADAMPYGVFTSSFDEFLHLVSGPRWKHFVQFHWPHWKEFGWRPAEFVARVCYEIRHYAALGARGMKVWKDLGLVIFHTDGTPARIDDERLEPIWQTAQAVGWTIAIHTADPTRSFPGKWRTGLGREELFARRDRMLAAHPKIHFHLCHGGNYAESVRRFSALLDRFPNVTSEYIPSMLAFDPPEDVAAFIRDYADRITLGYDNGIPDDRPPDVPWTVDFYAEERKRLRSLKLDDETFRKLTWETGERLFLKGKP